jgi:nitrogen fixation protein FixH
MTSPQQTGSGGLTGWHVLFALVGFFAAIFVVNAIFIYKAESTFGGLDTDDAYRKGLNYNERIVAARAQEKLGWRDSLEYVADGKRMRLSLSDTAGDAVSGVTVTAVVKHPATTRFDRELVLQQTGPGTYEVAVPELESGWWTVEIKAEKDTLQTDNAAHYESRRRLWIKP